MPSSIASPTLIVYEDVITYPPVRQDLAFVVPDDVTAGELVASARAAAGSELRDMRAFDVYRGDQIGGGTEVDRLPVTFQSPERTLTDEDAAELRNRIVAALEQAVRREAPHLAPTAAPHRRKSERRAAP